MPPPVSFAFFVLDHLLAFGTLTATAYVAGLHLLSLPAWWGWRATTVCKGVTDAEDLYRRLRALGAEYLLVDRSFGPLPVPEDEAFRRLVREVYTDPQALLFELSTPHY